MLAKSRAKIIINLLLITVLFSLTGCSGALYQVPDNFKKIDAKAGFKLPKECSTKQELKQQKNKDILDSYKLEGGLKALQSLEIVKSAEIEKDCIKVNFICKNRQEKEQSLEEILWDNSLFLLYTVLDTFPEVKEIRLCVDKYYLDKFGNPYEEKIFILTANCKLLKNINRDYFQPEMLEGLVDFYMYGTIRDEFLAKQKDK
ncbi:hypothetical protein SAMN00017405_1694 [Desulfonispora thiosulfatigenes DSM 11270]|uniref:Uncharacterized protein n=1 Tax=Desulfonispora thiosulfatigenes DSM 11270 TaxID=656914 RepID=A0A1W1V287_DESTI|nr:hypothetical protein [Desulfonispora thiosulfatigenes]SMB87433.1 hypothetical protein SAMN00017405_1694 [Desulfonispora thiosulfatigenes DSM 11270]